MVTTHPSCRPTGLAQRNFRPTGLEERAHLVWLWVAGRSVHTIALLTGTSVTTVYRWIRRWQREGHVNSRPRSGRPRLGTRKGSAQVQLQHISSPSSWPTPASVHVLSPHHDPCDFHLYQVDGWTPETFTRQGTSWREKLMTEEMLSSGSIEGQHAVYPEHPHHPDQRQSRKGWPAPSM